MPAQPKLNLNNKQEQYVYSGETSYLDYSMEIKEINLRYGKVLPNSHPYSPPKELEEEKEDSIPQDNAPPYPKRLVQHKQHTITKNFFTVSILLVL